jgi:AhpD family alkylhydroperoxidase
MTSLSQHSLSSAGSDDATTSEIPAPDSLAELLLPHVVPMAVLHGRYGALMELVRTLIGVVPNCDRYLEIWPPAFRTYNLVVPNLMNLPAAVFGIGGAPKAQVGLSMLMASRAADCPYCTAHTCSFALRRGATPETIAAALRGPGALSPPEAAVVAVATALGRVPCELTPDHRAALEAHFPRAQAEWIAMGAVAMGFLNKFMDATGVELEASTVAEVTTTLGSEWSPGRAGWGLAKGGATAPPGADSLASKARILRFLPSALLLDVRWQRGVPRHWPAVGRYLKQRTGHDFPVLGRVINQRCVRAIAAVLSVNLDPTLCVLPMDEKILAGAIFAEVVGNVALAEDMAALALHHGVSASQLASARSFALGTDTTTGDLSGTERAILNLARAAAPTPARITPDVVALCREAALAPQAIVELICWLSVLQMFHRLTAYCLAAPDT